MDQKRYVVMGYNLGDSNMANLRRRFPMFIFDVYEHGVMPPKDVLARAEILFNYGVKSQIPFAVSAKYIHNMSAGIDGYLEKIEEDLGPCVLLTNSAGVYNIAVGEHALALMLAAKSSIKKSILGMEQGKWRPYPILKNISGGNIAILGTGDIGSHLASIVKAMGAARVLGYKLHPAKPEPPFDAIYTGEDGLDEILALADFICVCLPGTPYTKGLINERRFGLIRRGAILVNIGRGFIVDTNAMMDALKCGVLAAAAMDVTDPEPLPSGHPLWRMDNVIITPHYAGFAASHVRHTEWFAKNLCAYLAKTPLPGAVNRKWKY